MSRVTPWTREEYMSKVTIRPDGCWEWLQHHNNHGYPMASRPRSMGTQQTIPAYRLGYILFVGPVADDLDCDHLCQRGWCANPYHIEPVTHRENIRRMAGMFGRRARATHCDRGHSDWVWRTDGRRQCLSCRDLVRGRRTTARIALRQTDEDRAKKAAALRAYWSSPKGLARQAAAKQRRQAA